MFLIAGLGNPDKKYEKTRHNIGFDTVDALAEKYNISITEKKHKALCGSGVIEGVKVILAKPQTYMNLSGNAVVKAAHFYKILPENIVVMHDDMDLPCGRLKAKLGGGSGGHNGIKSIDAAVSPNYNRIRIGVGHPAGSGNDVVNYVLGEFSKADKVLVEGNIELIAESIEVLLEKGIAEYSNRLGMLLRK